MNVGGINVNVCASLATMSTVAGVYTLEEVVPHEVVVALVVLRLEADIFEK